MRLRELMTTITIGSYIDLWDVAVDVIAMFLTGRCTLSYNLQFGLEGLGICAVS